MGKSLKNVVTPDEMCARYGADTFRVYEMSMGPLDVSRPWDTRAVVGAQRFLQRVWRAAGGEEARAGARRGVVRPPLSLQRVWRAGVDEEPGAGRVTDAPVDAETEKLLHRTIDA